MEIEKPYTPASIKLQALIDDLSNVSYTKIPNYPQELPNKVAILPGDPLGKLCYIEIQNNSLSSPFYIKLQSNEKLLRGYLKTYEKLDGYMIFYEDILYIMPIKVDDMEYLEKLKENNKIYRVEEKKGGKHKIRKSCKQYKRYTYYRKSYKKT